MQLAFVPAALGQPSQVPCATDACRTALGRLNAAGVSCYGKSFDDCWTKLYAARQAKREPTDLTAQCAQVWALYGQYGDDLGRAVDALSFCEQPSAARAAGAGLGGLVVGGIIGLGLGIALGAALGL